VLQIKAAGFNMMIGSIRLERRTKEGNKPPVVILGASLGGCLFLITVIVLCILKKKRLGPFKKRLQRFPLTEIFPGNWN